VNINNLIKTLTIEEKIGQLLQIAPFFFIQELEKEVSGNITDLHLNEKKIFRAGSVLGIGNATEMISVQKRYLEKSTHKIPLVFMADIIHGYQTIFPIPLALSTSWNPSLFETMGRISAIEASTAGIHVTFAPMVDISRDPRWGRVVEGMGEDPYLNQVMTIRAVKGFQGDDLKKVGHIASCVKHFAAYGAVEAGRDYNTVDMSRVRLFNDYMQGYKSAIDAGARLVMTAFNVVDGIPMTVNKHLLRTVLRDSWGFDGVTISDYDSLHQIIDHGVAENDEEAALLGIQAGLDIEMASICYVNYLKGHIESSRVPMKLLDEAVYRVLKLKDDLGLFEDPFKGASVQREQALVRSESHLSAAKQAALESAVLLKNDGTLPIHQGLKVAIIGPYANTRQTNGPWSWHGRNDLNDTLENSLKRLGTEVVLATNKPILDYTQEELETLQGVDLLMLALGENERESGEAHNRSDIRLPRHQERFVEFAKRIMKPSVVVLYHGRPLDLSNIMDANSILDAYYLGSMANEAIADLLTGKSNPSGKLTMTYPKSVGQIPLYYNHLNTGRPKVKGIDNEFTGYYLDIDNDPLFAFGYGRSYSNFVYGKMRLSTHDLKMNDILKVDIDITNDSDVDGAEIVQLYIRDLVSSISRPVKELKRFSKQMIKAHETVTYTFELSKDDLGYLDEVGHQVIEAGKFAIMVGKDSQHVQTEIIRLHKEVNS
jgi:beta-glucosidase